jgi:hypothetical protein
VQGAETADQGDAGDGCGIKVPLPNLHFGSGWRSRIPVSLTNLLGSNVRHRGGPLIPLPPAPWQLVRAIRAGDTLAGGRGRPRQ